MAQAARLITLILAASIMAASASLPAKAADCHAAAVEWAGTVWHMSPRLKVPIFATLGLFVGRPVMFAVVAANAESPRERRMIADYTAWCDGGFIGDPPRVGPAILELF